MGIKSDRVDGYIAASADFAQPILTHLRALVHAACPEVEETWKWSFPNFMYKGGLICSMAAFKKHCAFNFWKAAMLNDPDGILTVRGRDSMGNLGKIESINDLPSDAVLKKYIKAAMKLNEDGVKRAPKPKPTEKEKKEMTVPDYFVQELEKNEKAKERFNGLSYSHKKEYIEWLEDAKTELTRNKRTAQAITWIEEGKSRNWKYMNC